jgi:Phosphotransferase enzyme family
MLNFPCDAAMVRHVAALVGADPLLQPSIEALNVPSLNPISAGFYRVHFAKASVIVKLVRHADTFGHDRPDHMDYWLREPDLLATTWLQAVGGWRPVHCYAVEPLDDGRVALWLADLGQPTAWPAGALLTVARHFGQWAGYYHDRPANQLWLCRDFLPSWLGLAEREGFFAPLHDQAVLDHINVAKAIDLALIDTLLLVKDQGLAWAKALQQHPQTLCHHDASPGNLFLGQQDGQPITTAIDFGYLGLGAVGEDLGTLLATLILSFQASPASIDGSFDAVLAAYSAGFGEFSTTLLDPKQLRQAVLTAIVVRQVPFVGFSLNSLTQDPPPPWQRQWFDGLGGEDNALTQMHQAYGWLVARIKELQQLV